MVNYSTFYKRGGRIMGTKMKRIFAALLICLIVFNNLQPTQFVIKVNAEEKITLYFIDSSQEQWIGNDSAVIELVDNSNYQKHYLMTKVNETMWSAQVPKSAANITFNRMDSTQSMQWNSWSAGGRDSFTTYYAEGHEYGYWGEDSQEKYFHSGDVIYLDFSEFSDWKQSEALFYINFSIATKSENNGQDIYFPTANINLYAPKLVDDIRSEYLYAYIVTEEDERANTLRFWRGNVNTLWNCSVALTAEEYQAGMNCVKITDWNDSGYLTKKEEEAEIKIQVDTEKFEYNEAIDTWQCNQVIDGLSGSIESVGQVRKLEYQVTDVMENVVQQGKIGISEYWNIQDFGMVTGFNKITITATNKANEIYQESIEVFNTQDGNSKNLSIDESDDDGDGINNYQELLFGTDKDKWDTDGDGVSDIYELIILGTDPLKADSDENGVSDGDEDVDQDTLSNCYEIEHELNPLNADTDGDGLLDGDEMNRYHTNPLSEDTDEDGLSDGDEITLGFDPKKPDTDEDGILDCDEKVEQTLTFEPEDTEQKGIKKAAVNLSCSGIIENEVTIENIYQMDALFLNLQGLIGVPIEITAKHEFESAQITFEYEPEELGETSEEDLAIVWFDEANNEFVIYEDETVLDKENHTISYTTTHFSKYGVVDAEEYYEIMCKEMNYDDVILEEGQYYDISFLVDISTTMTYDSKFDRARKVLYSIANVTLDEDWEMLHKYAYSVSGSGLSKGGKNFIMLYSNYMTAGKDETYRITGGWAKDHNLYNALRISLENLEDSTTGNQQIMVIICDGRVNYNYKTDDICEKAKIAKERGIKIYVVNVDTMGVKKLEEIVEETGGGYFTATTEQEIQEIGKLFERASREDYIDSDGDGLYDVYEREGFKLPNGKVVCTDPYNADTDGDGVSDYDELGGMPQDKEIAIGSELVPVFANWNYKSNPLLKDTDGDGVDDLHDEHPLTTSVNYEDYVLVDMDFMSEVQEVMNIKEVGEKKRERDYGKGKYSEKEIEEIYKKYVLMGVMATGLEGAAVGINRESLGAKSILHYLDNSGTDFELSDMNGFITTEKVGKETYATGLEEMSDYFLNTLKNGESMTIVTKELFVAHENEINGTNPYEAFNWFITLGQASGYMVATATRNGDSYTMKIRYIVCDYYDWNDGDEKELIPGFSNAEMWKMTSLGIAKPYFVYGEIVKMHWF